MEITNKKMRILYVTKLKDSLANGVTSAVSQLVNSICKYAVVGLVDLNGFTAWAEKDVIVLNVSSWKSFMPDIVVFEDPFNSLYFPKMAKDLKKSNVPYIISPHGCFVKTALKRKALKKRLAMATLFKRFLNNCVATQFLCRGEMDKSVVFSKPIVIPNGIKQDVPCSVRTSLKRLSFIGRKDLDHKGIDCLLEAVNKTKQLFVDNNLRLNLYGPYDSKKDKLYVEHYLSENHLGNVVIDEGLVFGESKQSVLMNTDLFVLTSRYEGFPMSILEALSYGIPVLVSDKTNMDDIVSANCAGWVCKTDPDSIASCLKDVISSGSLSAPSKHARALAETFSWENVSKMTIAKYSELINCYHEE